MARPGFEPAAIRLEADRVSHHSMAQLWDTEQIFEYLNQLHKMYVI
jgi:hypothetical protein